MTEKRRTFYKALYLIARKILVENAMKIEIDPEVAKIYKELQNQYFKEQHTEEWYKDRKKE